MERRQVAVPKAVQGTAPVFCRWGRGKVRLWRIGPALSGLLFSGLVSALVGCASPGGHGDGQGADPPDPNTLAKGAALYNELCSVCHGDQGQGASGPVLRGFSRGEAELTAIIDARMPQGRPDLCKGSCARDVARYILSGFVMAQPVCDDKSTGPRRLRLLSRREYRNTIHTLFGWDDARCPAPEFRYKPTGSMPKTVHLAGSMNGWPGTVAAAAS